jgi:hypothetical protein
MPSIAQDRQGYPIDLERPIVVDEEGVHTELSMTDKIGDKYVNMPSIWNGKRYDPRKDEDYAEIRRNFEEAKTKGWRFPEFADEASAIDAAKDRSQYIDKLRNKEVRAAEKRMWDEESVKRSTEDRK